MTRQEIVKVYTKYDMPALTIAQSFIRKLTRKELHWHDNWSESGQAGFMSQREFRITSIEEGLEGVRFFHYSN